MPPADPSPLGAVEEALKDAISTIHAWHGDVGWGLYQQSPEMKRIRAALSALGRIREGAVRVWWCGRCDAPNVPWRDTDCGCGTHGQKRNGCGWRWLLPPDPEEVKNGA